ncbi:putative type I secretion system, ATP-binding protein [Vibrio ichthyoenteri ATCC 700023]|uniref:Putative type I secretion system, ATP-binding protein n=1 Tax=Vibrio ichthyoenteri ATCC 700023 TaxID=870968 RepID=F9S762_9VIBR|nr:type I secretion system permease/ATPase [Vibrio ichthyoenteri]EGU31949.1 putative type I secretion system, ATP-binding protein [Vibrio ichthyoenteri ATCC 700023]
MSLDLARDRLSKNPFDTVRKEIWAAIAFSLGVNLLVLAVPIYSLQLFDRVMGSASLETMFALLAITVFLVSSQALLEYVRTLLMQRSALKLDTQLSGELLAKSISESSKSNRIEKNALQNLTTLRNFLVSPSTSSILDLPFTPLFLLLLFAFHPYIGSVALVGALVFAGLAAVMMLGGRKISAQAQQTTAQVSMELNDYLRNAPTLKAMGMSENVGNAWQKTNASVLQLQWLVNSRVGLLLAISRYFRTLLQVAVLTCGVYLALQQQIGIGAVIASSILIGRVLSPFESAVSGWKSWYSAFKAWQSLNQTVTNTTAEKKILLPEPKGDIQFSNVSLKFANARKPTIQGISFKLGAGNALAVMGNSGSGKSTLAGLLMGIQQPSMGEILIDGASIEKWNLNQFGQYIGYLPQHVGLLAGTVKQNICRFTDGDDEAVIRAAKLACIHEIIMSLPEGYETYIGEGGVLLSGGQKQRIGLARAIYSNPRVLVLDEPNSNLDPEGETALAIVLQHCKEHQITVVMISHRPGFLRQMDWVIKLKDGKVEKAGTCEQFLGLHVEPELVENKTSKTA